MIKLSIIVPVYNVERYIQDCLESIFRQGLSDDEFEVIIINDGTPDKSMEKISDIINNHKNIQVNTQSNQGLSIVRNIGIEKANGEYIIFVDSDDLLVDNCLPILIKEANTSQADLVIADYIETRNDDIPTLVVKPIELTITKKNGKQLYLEDFTPNDCHVWHTLYNRKFLINTNIRFEPNIYFEDIPFTHECYLKANQCLKTNMLMYIYRRRGTMSITSHFDKKSGIDLCTALSKTWELTKDKNLSPEIITKLKQNIYISFSLLTYLTIHKISKKSEKLEIIRSIKHIAPDMQFRNGFRQKSVTFMYKRLPYTYVFLRILYAKHIEKQTRNLKKKFKQIVTKTKKLRI